MSKSPSAPGHTTDPKKPPKTITRRRGACKGCKLKKIRCGHIHAFHLNCHAQRVRSVIVNWANNIYVYYRQWGNSLLRMRRKASPTLVALRYRYRYLTADLLHSKRTGSTCKYEPKKPSDTGEPDLHALGKPHVSNQLEHNRDRPPSSTESEGLESANEPQTLSMVGSSPTMFSLDTNMDFLFSSGTFAFPNPSEDLGIDQAAPLLSDYHVVGGISGTQHPVNHSAISSAMHLDEFETGGSTAADSAGALSSPWPTLERRMTQGTNHVSYRSMIRDRMKLEQEY